MLWITTAFVRTKRDQALEARREVRQARAMGNAAPKLRMDQIDNAVSNCTLVYDSEKIARDHYFVHYYTAERIERLVEAILTIQDYEHPKSALLKKLMEILSAPNTVAALTPFLEAGEPSVVYYALWRLDRLVCGSSGHLADDTLRRAFSSSVNDPDRFAREKASYACKLIQKGIWPPKAGRAAFPEDSSDASAAESR
ncbi:MAG: hypothetical protein HY815_21175 [Candidatus Riflebacteria bacterium]|nr:hypothetical protein [Candidatus Riflebacteria bacterium]